MSLCMSTCCMQLWIFFLTTYWKISHSGRSIEPWSNGWITLNCIIAKLETFIALNSWKFCNVQCFITTSFSLSHWLLPMWWSIGDDLPAPLNLIYCSFPLDSTILMMLHCNTLMYKSNTQLNHQKLSTTASILYRIVGNFQGFLLWKHFVN